MKTYSRWFRPTIPSSFKRIISQIRSFKDQMSTFCTLFNGKKSTQYVIRTEEWLFPNFLQRMLQQEIEKRNHIVWFCPHNNNPPYFRLYYTIQRWTRLQILQTALQFCSKNMPNFHKRRFRYFEGFFPHKLTNIAGFDWVNKRRFFRAFGTQITSLVGDENSRCELQLPTAEDINHQSF